MISLRHLTLSFFFFFFNDTATTEIYTLSLHDALPICSPNMPRVSNIAVRLFCAQLLLPTSVPAQAEKEHPRPKRSEEHTSELQSLAYLVCRLLLEKKKKKKKPTVLDADRIKQTM